MLVLSRKIGEEIVIGEGVVVVVKKVSGKRVTLGIEAPHGMRIIRRELKPFGAPVADANPAAPASLSSGGEPIGLPLTDVWSVPPGVPKHH